MPAVYEYVRSDSDPDRRALIEESVDRPKLQSDSTAALDFRVALIDERCLPVEVGQQALAIFRRGRQRLLAEERVHHALAPEKGKLRLGDVLGLGRRRLVGLLAERTAVLPEPVTDAHRRGGRPYVARRADSVDHDPVKKAVGKVARDGEAVDGRRAVDIRRAAGVPRLRVVIIVDAGAERDRDSIVEQGQIP